MKTILFLLLFAAGSLSAQEVRVIKLDELEQRFTASGDTTLIVNFWATWCVPCIKELPAFDSISRQYENGKIKVLLVSLDFSEDLETKVKPFLAKRNLHPEVVLLDEVNGNYFIPRISEKWSGAIPATLILNQEKKYRNFIEKKLTYAELSDAINLIP